MAMMRKNVPDYLLQMIDDYLSDRWVIYEGDKWSLKEEMTFGAPHRRLSFGEHLKIAAAKAVQCGANLARLMPNIDEPKEAKRRLVASVVHSKLLYAATVWANAPQNHAIQRRLFSAQRSVALRIVSAYRTVSTSAVLVLASVPPIDLFTEERQETFQLRKELTCTDLQKNARAKEAIRKDERRRLVEKWQMRWHGEHTGRWTYRLIPELATWLNREHGEVGFYLAQALSGHGCFNAYLRRFKERDEEMPCPKPRFTELLTIFYVTLIIFHVV